MEQRLIALQTSLNVVETSITKFKNLLEDCQMVKEEVRHIEEDEAHQEEEVCHLEEDEAHQEEEVHHLEEDEACQEEEEEEETANIKMVDEEEHGNLESSGPHREADTKEEEAILMQQTPQPEDPAAGSHSPRSKTGTVLGGMAELCLTSPNHPGPEEDETPP